MLRQRSKRYASLMATRYATQHPAILRTLVKGIASGRISITAARNALDRLRHAATQ